ncbi:MAG: hypothetical protein ABI875_08880 [Gemmatimonadales bacterium]
MRSSLFRRTFWLILSLWLGPSIVVPEMVDQCPVHSFAAGAVTGHSSHLAMAGHNHGPKDQASHRSCTCLDQGCASGVAALPPTAHSVFSIVRFIVGTGSIVTSDHVTTVAADFLLPPITGPPPRV